MLNIKAIYQIENSEDVFVVHEPVSTYEENLEISKILFVFERLGIENKHNLLPVDEDCLNYSEMPPHKVLYRQGEE